VSCDLGQPSFSFAARNQNYNVELKTFGIMAGLFIIIVATVAVADMFCDYLKMDDENIAL
jgi:hypothetical protein